MDIEEYIEAFLGAVLTCIGLYVLAVIVFCIGG